ncbi:MAG TPA: RnfABCDGE type electron transport complex subunit D [Clostridia bacterium]|nr:RnfABCDGE type electron transport complex subunit D [Clostridia bacterium]
MTNTYPLLRVRWSNEHIMAVLFAVLLLYMLPVWVGKPGDILAFLAVLVFSLLLDAISGFMRYKKPVCSVSAAVTAGILQVLTPGIPLWGRLIGVFAAIIIGKQLWGGTGKNTMNPAILGYLVICIMFPTAAASLETSALLIPALVLSLPFILFRPFAVLGYFAGIIAAFLTGSITDLLPITASCVFLGSIVLTDPVTVTPLRSVGLAGGFAAAFLPLYTANPALFFALAVLAFNLVSYLADEYFSKPHEKPNFSGLALKSPYKDVDYGSEAADLSINEKTCAGEAVSKGASEFTRECTPEFTPDIILERIKRNGVYGMGGGAFPTAVKINDVMSSDAEKRYLIVNAVECDPGLVHDKWILNNRNKDIIKGIELISRCIGFRKKCIAVKDNTEIEFSDNIEVFRVKKFYPAGYEKALIRRVLGIDVPDGSIPSKLGILVLNVQTVLSVYEAVYLDMAVDSKYITVSDITKGTARTVRVKLGERVSDIIERIQPGSQLIFTGGGVMQAHMADDGELIGKSTNLITVSPLPRFKESPFCSNCGSCKANCPKGLAVNRIAELTDLGKFDEIERYRPEKCIKCGLCSYVCLAGRNLSAKVSEAREKVLYKEKVLL